jgi:ribonuclease HI
MRTFYTDGSCHPNPGPGGCAVIENRAPIYLGFEAKSTNNRMEGMAILAALHIGRGDKLLIITDSMLWVNTLTKWAINWKKRGFTKIKNPDIVIPAFRLFQESDAKIEWVAGHSGNVGNSDADYWANKARARGINVSHTGVA